MKLLTTQEQKFVSIFIKPTVDLTTTLEPAEKGVCMGMGKLSYGNPYYAVILGNATEKLKSTKPVMGGVPENEFAYHIADFFSAGVGKMVIARAMGATSTTKVLEVKKDSDTGVYSIDSGTDINVFGDNNIQDYKETEVTEVTEVVIGASIQKNCSVTIDNVNDVMTVKLFDEFGNEIYKVTGGTTLDSVDDYNVPNYIGLLTDNKIATIKVKADHDDYSSNFSVVASFPNGLIAESGDINYAKALEIVDSNVEKCDYAIAGGLSDAVTLQTYRSHTYRAKLPLIIDTKGDTLADAISFKTQLNMNTEDTCHIWNRGEDKFIAGDLKIGLSGFYAGQAVRRNLSKMVDDVEYRVEGIAGQDYQVPRVKADELKNFSNEDLDSMVDNRINPVREFNGKLVIADVLSGNPKYQSTRLFPVVEGKLFIDRYIARILEQKLFKNLGEAKLWTKDQCRLLFDKCSRNGYFKAEATPQYKYTVSDKDNDTVVVEYEYVAEGVMRRGIVQGSITKKIEA